jgi:hypothetical protein
VATIYGASGRYLDANWVSGLPAGVEHLRAGLGETVLAERVAAGETIELGDAVAYAANEFRLPVEDTLMSTALPRLRWGVILGRTTRPVPRHCWARPACVGDG